MSTILIPALISVAAMSLLVAGLYLHLYLVNRDRLLKLWSAAWGIYSLRFIVQTLIVLHVLPPWMVVIQEAATMAGALLCMTGAYALTEKSIPSWWWYGAGAVLFWVSLTQIIPVPFFWSDLPSSSFTGLLFAWSGLVILREVKIPGAGRSVSSYALILWGLHRADYTFLRQVAWFAPWGFLLAAVLFLAAAIGLLLLYYDKIRAELLKEIKDRNLVQEKLAENEAKYRMLFENMSPGVFYQRMDGVLTDCNQSALDMFGLTRDQFLGKNSLDPRWKVVKEDGSDLPGDQHPSMLALNGGRPVQDMVLGVFNPHKKDYTWLVVNAIPQFKAGMDKPYQVFVTLHDISERKKMAQQLLQAQKMESIGRLAGGVAHDFNNMLSIILGNTEILLDDMNPLNPAANNLREIQKAAERSTNLTRQLLAFARKQTISPKTLDLNKTVEGMLKMLRRLIGENIDLTWLPKMGLWMIKFDPSQIDQILVNLCVNSRDSIKDVGKITIETDNVSFDNEYCREHDGFKPGDYAMIAVSDNGCGMDKKTLENLFEPFFTTKKVGEGTGLGLATVYGIVKQNNGFINVYSEPEKGTSFRIFLSKHTESDLPVPSQESKTDHAKGSETILLVEDEEAILKMTTLLLERLGYTVLGASNPDDALNAGTSYPGKIDLLLTDVVMPGMNGKDLAEKISQLFSDLKYLFMSGYTANAIAHHGVLDEGVSFIQKPFSSHDLAKKVRAVLDKKSVT